MSFTHIDCFSGPGGICTGLCAAGFDTKIAIEYIKSCVETYSANHPSVHMIHSDIRDVTEDDILPYIPSDGIDLVTSGMPCETFSTAGNTSRSFYDDRQFLFREGIRIAKISKAKLLLFENVPAITTKTVEKKSKALIVDLLKKELVEAGYGNYIEVVLSADKFGVPQRRNRFFILASSNPNIRLTAPIPENCKIPVFIRPIDSLQERGRFFQRQVFWQTAPDFGKFDIFDRIVLDLLGADGQVLIERLDSRQLPRTGSGSDSDISRAFTVLTVVCEIGQKIKHLRR